MKRIRMLGLAVVAALAAMAFVGAGSASATTLCKENVAPLGTCPGGSQVSLPTTINATAKPVQFSAGEYEESCSTSEMGLKVEKSLGAGKGLSGQISSLSFSACTWAGCSNPEVKNLPYHAEIHEAANGNGTLTLSNGGSGKPTLRFTNCLDKWGGHAATCAYSAEKIELGFEGAIPSVLITANDQQLTHPLDHCIVPGVLDVTLNYVVNGQSFTASTSESKIAEEETTLSMCGSEIGGSLSGTISSSTFSGCSKPGICSSAKALNLPYGTTYVPTGSGEGTLKVSNALWELAGCPFGAKCKIAPSGPLSLQVSNNQIVAKDEPFTQSGTFCLFLESPIWNATYSMSGSVLAVIANP